MQAAGGTPPNATFTSRVNADAPTPHSIHTITPHTDVHTTVCTLNCVWITTALHHLPPVSDDFTPFSDAFPARCPRTRCPLPPEACPPTSQAAAPSFCRLRTADDKPPPCSGTPARGDVIPSQMDGNTREYSIPLVFVATHASPRVWLHFSTPGPALTRHDLGTESRTGGHGQEIQHTGGDQRQFKAL